MAALRSVAALFFKVSDTRLRFWLHEVSIWQGFCDALAGLLLGGFGVVAFFCSTILTIVKAMG